MVHYLTLKYSLLKLVVIYSPFGFLVLGFFTLTYKYLFITAFSKIAFLEIIESVLFLYE